MRSHTLVGRETQRSFDAVMRELSPPFASAAVLTAPGDEQESTQVFTCRRGSGDNTKIVRPPTPADHTSLLSVPAAVKSLAASLRARRDLFRRLRPTADPPSLHRPSHRRRTHHRRRSRFPNGHVTRSASCSMADYGSGVSNVSTSPGSTTRGWSTSPMSSCSATMYAQYGRSSRPRRSTTTIRELEACLLVLGDQGVGDLADLSMSMCVRDHRPDHRANTQTCRQARRSSVSRSKNGRRNQ